MANLCHVLSVHEEFGALVIAVDPGRTERRPRRVASRKGMWRGGGGIHRAAFSEPGVEVRGTFLSHGKMERWMENIAVIMNFMNHGSHLLHVSIFTNICPKCRANVSHTWSISSLHWFIQGYIADNHGIYHRLL